MTSPVTVFPGTVVVPAGLLMAGWGTHTHWIVVDIVRPRYSSSREALLTLSCVGFRPGGSWDDRDVPGYADLRD